MEVPVRRALSATLIVALLSPACKMKSAAMDESKSVDLATAEAPPAPQGATGAGSAAAYDVAAKADKVGGKAEDAKPHDAPATWKRSTVVPNATRLMVGEHEELALRTMQSRVTIDGFRARVL